MTAGFVIERRERTRVAEHNDLLEQRVRERTAELRDTQLEVVRRLGQAVESRDGDTGEHIERISRLCQQLALALGLSEAEAELIGHASTMHDVGKIGIPDSVLLKPSRLDADEWALMQSHTTIGAAILAGSSSPLLQTAESIALTHHERWDGTGYPAGLRGDAIPLAARICAVCDVFDALLSKRRYKRGWTMEEAIAELLAQRGRHFDPVLVDVFVALVPGLDEEWPTDARGEDPGVGVLTLDQSTAERCDGADPLAQRVAAHAGVDAGLARAGAALAVARRADDLQRAAAVTAEHRAAGVALAACRCRPAGSRRTPSRWRRSRRRRPRSTRPW